MKEYKIYILLSAVLLLSLCLGVRPVFAQDIALHGVEPAEGLPGQELEIALMGHGFPRGRPARVIIEGVGEWEAEVISPDVVRAHIFIPEDAPPGPRSVTVIFSFGENEQFPVTLEAGFRVLEREFIPPQLPEPIDGGEGGFQWAWWILILILGAISLGSVTLTITLAVSLRNSALRQQWQAESQEQELPKNCQSGAHYIHRQKPEVKPGRWRVTGLKVALSEAGKRVMYEVPSNLVGEVDKAARQRLLWGDSQRLGEKAREIARGLCDLVAAWQVHADPDRQVLLEAHLEGGKASCKFVRYRCVGKPGTWQKQVEWTVELKVVDHHPGAIQGLQANESPATYRPFLEDKVTAYIASLIQEAGRLV